MRLHLHHPNKELVARANVYLDGVLQQNVIEADEERCLIRIFKGMNQDGKLIIQTERGKVYIEDPLGAEVIREAYCRCDRE